MSRFQLLKNFFKDNFSNFTNSKFSFSVFVFITCLIGASYIGFRIPREINALYQVFPEESTAKILWTILTLFSMQFLIQGIYQYVSNNLVLFLMNHFREKSYSSWIYAQEELGESKVYSQGEVLARIMNDTNSLKDLVLSGAQTVFIDLFFVLSLFIGLLSLNHPLSYSVLFVELILTVVLFFLSKYVYHSFALVRESYGKVCRITSSLLAGLEELSLTPNKNYSVVKSEKSYDLYLRHILRANFWDAGYYALAESLYPLFLAVLILLCVATGWGSIALLGVVIDTIQRSVGPIKDLAGKISNLQRVSVGIEKMSSFQSHLKKLSFPYVSQSHMSSLHFFLPSFQYKKFSGETENRKLFSLSAIDIKLEVGTMVGVVGPSGGGKSTLLKLISGGLYAPGAKVIYNDKSFLVKEISDLSWLRSHICYVNQELFYFRESLLFNISFNLNEDTRFQQFWDEISCQIHYLNKFNSQLKKNLSPESFSMGEIQLISLLRSLYHSFPVVLFDEITSGLDPQLEHSIAEVLRLLSQKSLVLLVAHRLESVVNCDYLYFVNKGKVIAQGRHSELLLNSEYHEFYEWLKK